MRRSLLFALVLVSVVAVSACHRHNRVSSRGGGPAGTAANDGREVTVVAVALHGAGDVKDPSQTISLRVLEGGTVLGAVSIGQGESWAPDGLRAQEVRLSQPFGTRLARNLRLEVARTGPAAPPLKIQAEALGTLSDGGVVRLLELSPPATLTDRHPTAQWRLEAH